MVLRPWSLWLSHDAFGLAAKLSGGVVAVEKVQENQKNKAKSCGAAQQHLEGREAKK